MHDQQGEKCPLLPAADLDRAAAGGDLEGTEQTELDSEFSPNGLHLARLPPVPSVLARRITSPAIGAPAGRERRGAGSSQ